MAVGDRGCAVRAWQVRRAGSSYAVPLFASGGRCGAGTAALHCERVLAFGTVGGRHSARFVARARPHRVLRHGHGRRGGGGGVEVVRGARRAARGPIGRDVPAILGFGGVRGATRPSKDGLS
eukprot:3602860-Prymnesium_polylepis.1